MVDAVTLGALQRLSFPRFSTAYSLTAASGASQATGTAITAKFNQFTTVAGSGYSATLPGAARGREISVFNAGANAMAIYPSGHGTGDAIDGLGANNAYTLAAGGCVTFRAPTEAQWYSDNSVTEELENLVLAGTLSVAGLATLSSGAAVTGNVSLTGYLLESVAATVSAAGTNQAAATVLAAQINDVTTVGSGSGVVLPTAVAGMKIEVYSNGANNLKVYPPGANTVDGGSASAAVTLTSTHRCAYTAISAGSSANWLSALLGAVSS